MHHHRKRLTCKQMKLQKPEHQLGSYAIHCVVGYHPQPKITIYEPPHYHT